MSDVRVRRHADGRVAVSSGGRWSVAGAASHPWVDECEVAGEGWSELLVAQLPEPDGWINAVDDNCEDARTPYWETGHSTYTTWNDGVEDGDGLNEGTDLEWLRVDALKMLAAVDACERYRAEQET